MSEEIEQGLRQARDHLARAALETLEAARVLLDLALRSSGLSAVGPDSLAGEIGRSLDALVAAIREGRPPQLPPALATPLAEALQAEIERWEARSRSDPDARPVLRAFLGLREILWEFGIRSARHPAPPPGSHPDSHPREPAPSASTESGEARKPRLQRFDIES